MRSAWMEDFTEGMKALGYVLLAIIGGICIAFLVIVVCFMLAISSTAYGQAGQTQPPVHDHLWYDGACCNEQDCRPENVTKIGAGTAHEVVRRDDGWFVTSTNELIPFGDKRIKVSQDTRTHLCMRPVWVKSQKVGEAVRCLYLPEAGG